MAAAVAWGSVLEQQTGMRVRITQAGGRLRTQGIADGRFFSVNIVTTELPMYVEAWQSEADPQWGPFPMRAVWPMSMSNQGYAVPSDSPIETPLDIKPGIRIGWMSFASTGKHPIQALLAWAGLTEDQIVWVPAGSYNAMVRMIDLGKADLIYCFPFSPAVIEAETAPAGLKWVELNPNKEPEEAARFLDVMPTAAFAPMSGAATPSAHGVWSIEVLGRSITRAETDPELVYHVAKWFHENHALYRDKHPWCAQMTIDNLEKDMATGFVPYHDGVVRLAKELGFWDERFQRRHDDNVELLTRYVNGFQACVQEARSQGVDADPLNEAWWEYWETWKTRQGLPKLRLFPGLE
jgi:TRAP-type uncharacterized transport system substrate-binding protein